MLFVFFFFLFALLLLAPGSSAHSQNEPVTAPQGQNQEASPEENIAFRYAFRLQVPRATNTLQIEWHAYDDDTNSNFTVSIYVETNEPDPAQDTPIAHMKHAVAMVSNRDPLTRRAQVTNALVNGSVEPFQAGSYFTLVTVHSNIPKPVPVKAPPLQPPFTADMNHSNAYYFTKTFTNAQQVVYLNWESDDSSASFLVYTSTNRDRIYPRLIEPSLGLFSLAGEPITAENKRFRYRLPLFQAFGEGRHFFLVSNRSPHQGLIQDPDTPSGLNLRLYGSLAIIEWSSKRPQGKFLIYRAEQSLDALEKLPPAWEHSAHFRGVWDTRDELYHYHYTNTLSTFGDYYYAILNGDRVLSAYDLLADINYSTLPLRYDERKLIVADLNVQSSVDNRAAVLTWQSDTPFADFSIHVRMEKPFLSKRDLPQSFWSTNLSLRGKRLSGLQNNLAQGVLMGEPIRDSYEYSVQVPSMGVGKYYYAVQNASPLVPGVNSSIIPLTLSSFTHTAIRDLQIVLHRPFLESPFMDVDFYWNSLLRVGRFSVYRADFPITRPDLVKQATLVTNMSVDYNRSYSPMHLRIQMPKDEAWYFAILPQASLWTFYDFVAGESFTTRPLSQHDLLPAQARRFDYPIYRFRSDLYAQNTAALSWYSASSEMDMELYRSARPIRNKKDIVESDSVFRGYVKGVPTTNGEYLYGAFLDRAPHAGTYYYAAVDRGADLAYWPGENVATNGLSLIAQPPARRSLQLQVVSAVAGRQGIELLWTLAGFDETVQTQDFVIYRLREAPHTAMDFEAMTPLASVTLPTQAYYRWVDPDPEGNVPYYYVVFAAGQEKPWFVTPDNYSLTPARWSRAFLEE